MTQEDNIIVYRTGERIDLCPIRTEDVHVYQRWMNDPEISHFLNRVYPLTTEAELKWLERSAGETSTQVILGIRLKDSRVLIGNCSLFNIDPVHRSACFGIVIGEKEHWSEGYGTEATKMMLEIGFRDLNLNRIYLDVHSFNERAKRCYEAIGFVKEGVFRQAIYADGKYHDTIRMGLLKDEWFDLQPRPLGSSS